MENIESAFRNAATGFVSSATGIIIFHPIDTIARQLHVTNRVTAISLIKSMAHQGPRSFYKGVMAATITQPTYWAVNFPVYNALKKWTGNDTSFATKMRNGWIAGAAGTIVTNPLWVIRTRLQTEILHNRNTGYGAVTKRLWQENGYKTFFRGTNITLVKNVQMAFLMPLFDHWTSNANQGIGIWSDISKLIGTGATVAVAAATSKIVSSTIVYPLDVIRTNARFQEAESISYMNILKELMKRKGSVLNLFRGIGWYWISSAGMFAVMMSMSNAIM